MNNQDDQPRKDDASLWTAMAAGLKSRCPRCTKGRLFDGYLTVGKTCPSCGLDLSSQDTGDGPAVFIILIVGAIVVGAALFVELVYQPHYWVHAVLWLPLMIGLSLVLLRPFKAVLFALQYHYKAEEGRQLLHDDHRVS